MNAKSKVLLSKVYYDTKNPASFSSVDKLWEGVGRRVSKREIADWLEEQDAYTLHTPVRKRFLRNRYNVYNIDDLWQADSNDMRSLKNYNDNHNYILTVIDVFSKYAWARPLRKKTGDDVKQAFEEIFKSSKRIPLHLQTDKGREFLNKPFQDYLKEKGINFYVANNPDIKASIVERFNRTLKTKMWRMFTAKATYKYVDQLPFLLRAYNHSVHRSIGMPPANVNDTNMMQVWDKLYGKVDKKSKKPKFSIGDIVRISREKMIFLKGYEAGWSEELFRVTSVLLRAPVVYKISDWDGESIEGTFYEKELQRVKVGKEKLFKIDKILESRGKGRSKEVKVKWLGYGPQYNSWIRASKVSKLG